jgi:hypothetical protein
MRIADHNIVDVDDANESATRIEVKMLGSDISVHQRWRHIAAFNLGDLRVEQSIHTIDEERCGVVEQPTGLCPVFGRISTDPARP